MVRAHVALLALHVVMDLMVGAITHRNAEMDAVTNKGKTINVGKNACGVVRAACVLKTHFATRSKTRAGRVVKRGRYAALEARVPTTHYFAMRNKTSVGRVEKRTKNVALATSVQTTGCSATGETSASHVEKRTKGVAQVRHVPMKI